MTRRTLYTVSVGLLLLTTPWWFGAGVPEPLFGLPRWVVYSLAVTGAYAVTIGWLLERYWELSSGEDDP